MTASRPGGRWARALLPARHALAIVVLPFTVVAVVPAWIARARGLTPTLPSSPAGWGVALGGVAALAAGAALFAGCVLRFGTEGRGTLAPWDPPVALVTRGAYAHARNPMISGVVLVLLGEAMTLRSWAHLEWAGVFFLINAVYIPLVEEPMLRRRFGAAYDLYARNVPRFVPRVQPWRQEGDAPRSGPGPRGSGRGST